MLVALNKVDGGLSSKALYLICKDGTPFSVKHILPNLHDLYLQLSEKTYCEARISIMRIFVKMAMHSDSSSSVFKEARRRILYIFIIIIVLCNIGLPY